MVSESGVRKQALLCVVYPFLSIHYETHLLLFRAYSFVYLPFLSIHYYERYLLLFRAHCFTEFTVRTSPESKLNRTSNEPNKRLDLLLSCFSIEDSAQLTSSRN